MNRVMKPPKNSALANPLELMRLSEEVARRVYDLTDAELEEVVWEFDFKARYNGTEIVAGVAACAGAINPIDALFRLGHVRSLLYELRATLKLAHKTDRFAINPEVMIAIEQCIQLADEEIEGIPNRTRAWRAQHGIKNLDVPEEKMLEAIRSIHTELEDEGGRMNGV